MSCILQFGLVLSSLCIKPSVFVQKKKCLQVLVGLVASGNSNDTVCSGQFPLPILLSFSTFSYVIKKLFYVTYYELNVMNFQF